MRLLLVAVGQWSRGSVSVWAVRMAVWVPASGEHWWMLVGAFGWRPDPWNDGSLWSLLFRVG